MAAASLSASTSLLSAPTPPTHLFSLTSKPSTAGALNPRNKKPPPLSCAAASPTAPAAKAKAGSWRDLCSLNAWVVRDYRRRVDSVGAFEPALQRLSDEQLKAKTAEFRACLACGDACNDAYLNIWVVNPVGPADTTRTRK